jgi:hypothetical protein
VEHYLILKQAYKAGLHPRYLIYGFFDDQLYALPTGDPADLVGNRAFSYYFPAEAAELYAPGSMLKECELRILGNIPMYAERSSLWGKVEMMRRRMDEIGMPKKKTNRFGRVEDFAALEAKDIPDFKRRCDLVLSKPGGFSIAIHKIISLAHQHDTRVLLVEMPMPALHRNSFYSTENWHRLQQHLHELATRENATYVSASDWVRDDALFEDATHLNEEGAKLFSSRLADEIAALDFRPLQSSTAMAKPD